MPDVIRIAILFLIAGQALVAGETPGQLTDLSVEELLNTQVTSVGRKAQKLAQAPAAVFVLTQEDIRRSGATSLPEVLRLVPGLQVARLNGRTWAITARGANGQFSNKLLVLVDGRMVYSPMFSGVIWALQDTVLEDINRIEVIRGPGAMMWGANAVNGVINVITHRAAETLGTLVSVTAGDQDRSILNVRSGFTMGEKTRLRIYGRQLRRRLFDEDSSMWARTGVAASAGSRVSPVSVGRSGSENMGRLGFRLDRTVSPTTEWTVLGEGFVSLTNDAATDELRPSPRVLDYGETSAGGHLLTRWTRQKSPGDEATLQLSFSRWSAQAPLVAMGQQIVDVEYQRRRTFRERHELFWGLGGRWAGDGTRPTHVSSYDPLRRQDTLWSLMGRDEFQLRPGRWMLATGARLEHNNYSGWNLQPSVRLLYTPTAKHSFWGAVSRAVRTPSRTDHDGTISENLDFSGLPVLLRITPNRSLRPERFVFTEAGYRWQTRRLSVDGAAFVARNLGVVAYEPGPFSLTPVLSQAISLANSLNGWSRGVEVWAQWQARPNWRLIPAYTWLKRELWALPQSRTVEKPYQTGEDPAHSGSIRSLWEFSRRWQFDVTALGVGRVPGAGLAGYVRLDARLGWRPVRAHEFSFTMQNLTDTNRIEFVPDGFFFALSQRRAVVARWAFRP